MIVRKSKYFSEEELRCKVTGRCEMDAMFMERLDLLREKVNVGLIVTSGYRDPTHPDESGKPNGPGAHALGLAVDIACSGALAYKIIEQAVHFGFLGIGLQQSLKLPTTKRFIHLDRAPNSLKAPRPTVWSY